MLKLKSRRNNPTFSDEPSSPKVSCMGQVQRNNRVASLPAAAACPITTHHTKYYSKLKKLFSSKTLLPPAAAGGGRSRSSKGVCVDDIRRLNLKKGGDEKCEQECGKILDIGKLDPPLPVVKRVAPPEVNLWRRRIDGAAPLEKLQIIRETAI